MNLRKLFATATIFSVVIAAGCCRKCNAPSANREYKPLVPDGTVTAFFSDHVAENDPFVKEVYEIINQKSKEYNAKILEAAQKNGTKEVPAPDSMYSKLMNMTQDERCKFFYGVEPSDILWSLSAIGQFKIPDNIDNDTKIELPDCTMVCAFAKPVDLDKIITNCYTVFISAPFPCKPDNVMPCVDITSEMKKFVRVDKGDYKGRPAWRLVVVDQDVKSHITNLAPVITTSDDKCLIFCANNDAALAKLDGLYSGTVAPAPANSKIVKEMAIADGTFTRLTFPDPLAVIKNAIRDKDKAMFENQVEENPKFGKYVKNLDTFRMDAYADTTAKTIGFRYEFKFLDETIAEEMRDIFTSGMTLGRMFIPRLTTTTPQLSFLSKLVEKVISGCKADTAYIGIEFSIEDIKAFNASEFADSLMTVDNSQSFEDEEIEIFEDNEATDAQTAPVEEKAD